MTCFTKNCSSLGCTFYSNQQAHTQGKPQNATFFPHTSQSWSYFVKSQRFSRSSDRVCGKNTATTNQWFGARAFLGNVGCEEKFIPDLALHWLHRHNDIIIEQCLEWQTPLYSVSIDFQKAFDSVDRDVIWRLMNHYGFPPKFVTIIHRLYEDATCQVIRDGKLTEPFSIQTEVCQGCLLSPTIFLLVVD